ncbi:hypothetical protein [Nocardia sp. NPDC046763]|uniref:hypothetical protein n=1 Tax=Nocardia sp. NPDC046763 TaxID=3155256 RepID=UPI0033F4B3EF
MSSAGIRYRVVSETVLREQAQQRLRRVSARARRVSQRCVAAGLPELEIAVAAQATSAEIEAACTRLEAMLAAAEPAIRAAQIRRRAQQVDRELTATLTALARRENAATATGQQPAPAAHTTSVDRRQRRTARVQRLLATMLEPSADLEQAGIAVCRSDDPVRAELLLSELDTCIAAANAATRRLRGNQELLAELRDSAIELNDRGVVTTMLDNAAATLARRGDATAELERARALLDTRSAMESATRERRFVLTAVYEALAELGYTATPVAMDTAGSIVLTAPGSGTVGVRARIVDGEIDIRTVRTGAAPTAATEEAAVCTDLSRLADSLRARGVLPERLRQSGPGLARVEMLATGELGAESSTQAGRMARKSLRERSADA